MKRLAAMATMATALCLGLTACAGSSDDASSGAVDQVELVYASFIPEEDPNSLTAKRWMDLVTERTEGAVTFDASFGGTLCGATDMLSCVQSARADVGSMSLSYFPSELPLLGLGAVPFQTSNLHAAINATYQYAQEQEEVQAELSAVNLHPMYVGPAAPPILGTTEPVRELEDVAGQSIRALGVLGASVQELGWSPVDISANELYEALQRGTIDGALFPVNGMVGFRLIESASHFYDMGRYIGVNDNTLTMMNQDVWSGLTPELQETIAEVNQEIIDDSIATDWAPSAQRDCQDLLKSSETFAEMPGEDQLEAWAAEQKGAQVDRWKTAVESRIDNADELAETYAELIREHEDSDSQSPAEICLGMADS